MNTHEAKVILLKILDEKAVFKKCVLIDGAWGIGKTHLIKQLEEDSDNEFYYVSIFGKSSIRQIESSLIFKILLGQSNKKKEGKLQKAGVSAIKQLVEKFSGLSIDAVTSTIAIEDLENIIDANRKIVICFDDFERKSDELPMKELLGLIERATNAFNVIVLGNFDAIDDEEQKLVQNYHEKIIDYYLDITKISNDIFDEILIENQLPERKDVLSVYLKGNIGFGEQIGHQPTYYEKNIQNLRLFKKYINLVKDVENEIGKVAIIDESVLAICKFVVYSNLIRTHKSDPPIDSYGIKKAIVNIFKREKYDKLSFSAYFEEKSEIKNTIYQIYDLHLLSETDFMKIIDEVKIRLSNKDFEYFKTQRNLISLYDALIESEYVDKEIMRQIENVAKEIYKPSVKDGVIQYDSEYWNSYDEWGESQSNKYTIALISKINNYNRMKFDSFIAEIKIKALRSKDFVSLMNLFGTIRIETEEEFIPIFEYLYLDLSLKYSTENMSSISRLIDNTMTDISDAVVSDMIKREVNKTAKARLKKIYDLIERKQFHEENIGNYEDE